MQEMQVRFLDGEDPLEKEMQPTPVLLPGKSHGQEGAWWIVVHVVPKSWTWLSTLTPKVSRGLHHFSAFFLFLNFTSNLGFCFPFGYIFAFLLCYIIFLDTPLYQVLRKNKLAEYQLSAVSPRVFFPFLKYLFGCVGSFFLIYFFNWKIIALQNFVVFCQTSTWISHKWETDIENRIMDMRGGEERVRCMERVTWKLISPGVFNALSEERLWRSLDGWGVGF